MDIEQYTRDLGSRLRRARTNRGMSLAQVQRDSGGRWTAAAVSAYERGDRQIRVEFLAGLAEFYGIDPRWLLPGAA